MIEYKSGFSYTGDHKPTGESWYILGIDVKGDRVCVAGWPPTIARLSDMENMEVNKPLSEAQINHRNTAFGLNWD